MNTVICAWVDPRLLSKASRLFTGAIEGRIIELLQNARRAGATTVHITNKDGIVTVADNGKGIEDFSKLLAMGGSGWEDYIENSEDPAGVGLFCLTPRQVEISSKGRRVVITKEAWTGIPIEVVDDAGSADGTTLRFMDDKWEFEKVQEQAVFSGMEVAVDGKKCAKKHFCSKNAVNYPQLGCRIEVNPKSHLEKLGESVRSLHYYDKVFVNFHGQVVAFDYEPLSDKNLCFFIDMTGAPTGIRLMLPARTRLVENAALDQLKSAIELEAYRYVACQDSHSLCYKDYLRAKELGIDLAESKPVFQAGLILGDTPEPVAVEMPENFPIKRCYTPNYEKLHEQDTTNIHILAALGKFKAPFVPVKIDRDYQQYNWAKIPTIDKVEVTLGRKLGESTFCCQTLVAASSINITAHASDGHIYSCDVPMAVLACDEEDKSPWSDIDVYVTTDARRQLDPSQIWYHLGGYSDDGDTYDTQEYEFEKELQMFWTRVVGPGEYLRSKIFESIDSAGIRWKKIIVDDDGTVTIETRGGKKKILKP